jgi:CDP-diglyceride synthetase
MARLRMKSATPTRKTTAGALGGAIATVLVWAVNTFVLTDPGQKITGEVAAAIVTIVTFAVSYFVAPGSKDEVVPA